MVCRNCGKILEGVNFCPECGMSVFEEFVPEAPAYTEEDKSRDRRYGLGRAIIANILPVAAMFSFFFVAIFAMVTETVAGFIVALFAFACCTALSIVSIVLSAKSIGAFKLMSREGRAKPIATLILGIVGLYDSIVFTAVFSLFTIVIPFAFLI